MCAGCRRSLWRSLETHTQDEDGKHRASFSELEPDSLILADGLPRRMPEDLDRSFRRGTSD